MLHKTYIIFYIVLYWPAQAKNSGSPPARQGNIFCVTNIVSFRICLFCVEHDLNSFMVAIANVASNRKLTVESLKISMSRTVKGTKMCFRIQSGI